MTIPVGSNSDHGGSKPSSIKLRLNLSSHQKTNSQDTVAESRVRTPPRKINKQDNYERNSENATKNNSSSKSTKTIVRLEDRPTPDDASLTNLNENDQPESNNSGSFKLKILLKKQLIEPAIEEEKPKLVLSLKRPNVAVDEELPAEQKVDVETVSKTKRPRAKRITVKEEKKSSTVDKRVRAKKEERPAPPPINPYSTIAAINPSTNVFGPKPSALSSFNRLNNMTRVPIAALTPFSSMTPSEREEERIWRQTLAETLGALWLPVAKMPLVDRSISSTEDIVSGALPYWLMLAPIDSAMNAPTLKTYTESVDRETRINEEYLKLRSRFEDFVLRDKNRDISTELLVLEQKLCLEEEKFLFAKLKSEYNTKVIEIMARKRRSEAMVSGDSSALVPPSASVVPHQRILPKMPGT